MTPFWRLTIAYCAFIAAWLSALLVLYPPPWVMALMAVAALSATLVYVVVATGFVGEHMSRKDGKLNVVLNQHAAEQLGRIRDALSKQLGFELSMNQAAERIIFDTHQVAITDAEKK